MDDARALRVVPAGDPLSERRASVPLLTPVPGCTTTPAGLSTTSTSSSSYTTRSPHAFGISWVPSSWRVTSIAPSPVT